MDKNELIEALRELDKRMDIPCDILIIGGAAMIIHYGARRATNDVEILRNIMHNISTHISHM
ncbi:MAG: hypothetical protein K8T10_18425 [Candidatus Eremiobacteraeota bacterium]|nr:hypothetical protein [Candidatus Eremiobacteraeota bacterium]